MKPPPANEFTGFNFVDGFQSPSELARATSRRRPYSPDLSTPWSKPQFVLAFEALKCAPSYVSPKRPRSPLGFLTFSLTAKFKSSAGPGSWFHRATPRPVTGTPRYSSDRTSPLPEDLVACVSVVSTGTEIGRAHV